MKPYPPTDHVEISRTIIQDREYIEIAEVSLRINKENEEKVVIIMKGKAAQLGADALILLGERSAGAVAMPVGATAVAVPLREIYGIAVKYK